MKSASSAFFLNKSVNPIPSKLKVGGRLDFDTGLAVGVWIATRAQRDGISGSRKISCKSMTYGSCHAHFSLA
jgi:hypothetical protein